MLKPGERFVTEQTMHLSFNDNPRVALKDVNGVSWCAQLAAATGRAELAGVRPAARFAIAVSIGVPLGIYAGYRPDGAAARVIMAASVIGFSVPTFWIGLVLILTFAVTLGWLPER